jgi:adenylate cyclase
VLVAGGIAAPAPASASSAAAPAASPTPSTSAADYGAILVVDDNASNRELLARRLARQGYEVAAAASGKEALDMLAARPFDLVLLDVLMPGLSGYEVLQRLKADENLRDIPVLMISALDELDSVVRCIDLGAEDYLGKPFDPVLLRARVGACLEKKRLRNLQKQQARALAEWNQLLEQRVAEQVTQMDKLGRLKRFFSPQLAELIVTGGADDPLKTHRREIIVVFLDLRGFTAFVESAEPEELMAVLREYHAAMGELILTHEGTLERFTGDGMMVFFNDPVVVPNAPERAIRMSVAMRDRVKEMAARWQKLGYDLDLGVGISQGYATIGAIGFEGRWDYGALGTVTNLAARLCGEAQGGQILVSRKVASAVESLVESEPIGALTLKGFARPVPASTITGLKPAVP